LDHAILVTSQVRGHHRIPVIRLGLLSRAGALTEAPDWGSGPLRSRAPLMTAPPAKIPAIHQNAVS